MGIALLSLFVLGPIVEIAVLISVGGAIGLWPTLGLVLLTAFVGASIVRAQGFSTLQRARARMDRGEPPLEEGFTGLCLVIAGVMLLTPGFVTDAFGFALLLPPARALLFRSMRARMAEAERQAARSGGGAGGEKGGRRGPVVDVAYEVVEDRDPANGEGVGGEGAPPPRGTWGPRKR